MIGSYFDLDLNHGSTLTVNAKGVGTMEKQKGRIGIIVVVLVLLALALALAIRHPHQQHHYIHSTTPTILVHGYNSSYHAWDKLIRTAKADGVTKTVQIAEVKKNGQVKLHGKKIEGRRNPIVAVNFDANKRRNTAADARANELGLDHVIQTLQKQEGMRRYNIVGHSMGNWNSFCYIADHDQDQSMPRLHKQVVLAGGGVHGWGHVNNPGVESLRQATFCQIESGLPARPGFVHLRKS